MTDQRLSDIALLADVADNDTLYVFDAGAADGRQAQVKDVAKRAYGAMSLSGGSGSQTGTGAFLKVDQFAANGLSLDTVPDHTQDQIELANAGIYRVTWNVSFVGTGGSNDFLFQVFWNGIGQGDGVNAVQQQRRVANIQVNDVSVSAIVNATAAGFAVDGRFSAPGTAALECKDMVMIVERIG